MEFSRTFAVAGWDDETRARAMQYWRERGVRFGASTGEMLRGRRGSLWGNGWGLSIQRFRTKLTIAHGEDRRLTCVLDVDPTLASISRSCRNFLELELATFESWLLRGDEQPEAWARLRADNRRRFNELAAQAQQRPFTRRGPWVVGGPLGFKAAMMAFSALVVPPACLVWGPRILVPLLRAAHGRTVDSLDTFERVMFGPVMATVMFAMFGGMAVWMNNLRRGTSRCVTLDEAAAKQGVSAQELEESLAARGVQPKYILNGDPAYLPDDVDAALRLLRPASAPDGALLRPTAAQPASGDTLVRPVAAWPEQRLDQSNR